MNKNKTLIPFLAIITLATLTTATITFEGSVITNPEDFNIELGTDTTNYDTVSVTQQGVIFDGDGIYMDTTDEETTFTKTERNPSGEIMIELQTEPPEQDVTIDNMEFETTDSSWNDEISLLIDGVQVAEAFNENSISFSGETIQAGDNPTITMELHEDIDVIEISWDHDEEYLDNFNLYREEEEAPLSGMTFDDIDQETPYEADISPDTFTTTDTDFEEGTEYCYQVTAENDWEGESGPTSSECITP